MKCIKVDNYYYEKGYYKIKLGTGTVHLFKSERKCKKFQSQINRYLSDLCLNYNQLYSDLHSLYRELWPCFYSINNSSRGKYFQEELSIKNEFKNIESLLELLTTNISRRDSFLRVYRDFEMIHESIQIIHHQINSVIHSKSIQFITARLNLILHQSTTNQKDLEEFSTRARNHPTKYDRTTAAIKYAITYSQTA